ncbi:hypothetical protein D3C76_871110 [compost metagenome]
MPNLLQHVLCLTTADPTCRYGHCALMRHERDRSQGIEHQLHAFRLGHQHISGTQAWCQALRQRGNIEDGNLSVALGDGCNRWCGISGNQPIRIVLNDRHTMARSHGIDLLTPLRRHRGGGWILDGGHEIDQLWPVLLAHPVQILRHHAFLVGSDGHYTALQYPACGQEPWIGQAFRRNDISRLRIRQNDGAQSRLCT